MYEMEGAIHKQMMAAMIQPHEPPIFLSKASLLKVNQLRDLEPQEPLTQIKELKNNHHLQEQLKKTRL